MNLNILKPRKALNKAFLKVKPNRSEIECFKINLIKLIDRINEAESEEFHKNIISDFLKNTYYKDNHFINTKGRNDLVVHDGKDAKSTVGVIVEAKKPANKSEMLRTGNINTKAFQELILYYLRERITLKNLEIKYLIVTNIYEWFIFDAQLFERLFAHNKILVKQFTDFEEKRLSDTRTDFFYKEIAEPFINAIETEITFTHFDIRNFAEPLRNADRQDDNKLIALYKLLSPEHLLKLPFTNDSNSLDKSFYTELLHIIGLTETKEGGKKLIGRKKEGERNQGSLMESAIIQLESLDKISRLEKAHRFGQTSTERLFNVALELSITWINRILFLKLLEAQLIKYNKGDKSFSFLHLERVRNFDDLNSLFFQVLARKPEERNGEIKKLFARVPYLNSSLFEPTEIEHTYLFISQLGNKKLPVLNATVLKDKIGKKRTGEMDALEYLFEFLNAYDFAGEGAEEIQEDNKTLINASVLGLIFEKINGYKDGSFFTPGFITMYMCRETIRRAVVQKFNEVKKWNCQDINQLYDKIEDRKEANQIINSLKICDPAVGSGHFLVSALNEIIAIKNDLKILSDREGKRLKEYSVEVVSDELIVTDEDGKIFEYNPQNKESRRIQETLFHEKQTIIENCLFGVDINPNSVKICRLRLWIELLKNAYYKAPTFAELETLPNIDINIKCGNSLISRYSLDADIKEALRRSKWSIDSYRLAVMTYRNAENKNQKQAMEKLINEIKSDFESEVAINDKRVIRLKKLKDELKTHATQTHIFELTKAEKAAWETKLKKLTAEINKCEAELEEINNKIYENAFEWRFEFPEVLNDEGDFVGFDVVIGNPPYISHDKIENKETLKLSYLIYEPFTDIYSYFFELGVNILRLKGELSFITSNSFLKAQYGKPLREYFRSQGEIISILNLEDAQIFQDAVVNTCLLSFNRDKNNKNAQIVNSIYNLKDDFIEFIKNESFSYSQDDFNTTAWNLPEPHRLNIGKKIKGKHKTLNDYGTQINLGIATGSNEVFILNNEKYSELIEKDSKNLEILKPILRGRDIKRYCYEVPDLKLILSRNEVNIENEYPTIYQYLDDAGDSFKKRGAQGKHWTNLRACSFFDDFKKEKIVWIELSDTNKFALCTEEIYLLNSAYFLIPPRSLSSKFLLGVLNSKLIHFYLSLIANTSGVGTTRWINIYVKEFPIPEMIEENQQPIEKLVTRILAAKKQDPATDITVLEKEIDQLVYQLYGLTEEEIKIVEQN